MDQSRFDQFTKRLGSSRVTRLAALRGLAVGALAAALGVADPDEAVARKRCGECEKRRRRKTKSGKVRIR